MTGPAIEAARLCMAYRTERRLNALFRRNPQPEVVALDDVSFTVNRGEVLGLVGRNGAGKTTLINILCTLVTPTSGRACVGGHDVLTHPERARRLVGLVTSNERSFYWRLTGRENLQFFGELYRVPGKELRVRIGEFLDALDLQRYADLRFDGYSTGVRQRFAFARALLHRPTVLFMDEPTKGLDPAAAATLLKLVRERILAVWRPTIVVTSHNLTEIEALCDRVAIVDEGRLLRIGTIADLARSVRSYEAYAIHLARADRLLMLGLSAFLGAGCVRMRDGPAPVLELRFDGTPTLSHALRYILEHGGEVKRCEPVDMSLSEVFHATLDRRNAA